MRKLALCVAMALVATAPFTTAQDANLRAQLEALHNQWFEAFDNGDGAAMDNLETTNLVLVFQNGEIWKKPGSRVGKVKPTGVKSRSLSDVEVRQFGDTAALTGTAEICGRRFEGCCRCDHRRIRPSGWKMDGCQCPLVTDQVAVANALARYGRRSRAVTFALNMIRLVTQGFPAGGGLPALA
jgi:hypothetical protein